jgi:hypothetical protein
VQLADAGLRQGRQDDVGIGLALLMARTIRLLFDVTSYTGTPRVSSDARDHAVLVARVGSVYVSKTQSGRPA